MNLPAKTVAAMLIAFVLGAGVAGAAAGGREAAARVAAPHASRVLSLDEIHASVQVALQSHGAPASALPSADQIRPAVPITVSVADPGLEVLRMDADAAPGVVLARLWTSGEPVIHPFDVRILADPGLLHWLAQRTDSARASLIFTASAKPQQESHAAQPRAPKQPALVVPGQAATLLLEQGNMEVRTPAMPLARGASGQWIRVRNLSTGQVLAAEVVGPGSLARHF